MIEFWISISSTYSYLSVMREFHRGGERRPFPLAAILGPSDHDRAEERPVRRQAGQNSLHVA
jgi:hypothetical protein